MVTKKTYYKNITHIPGQIVVNLPNGSRRTFKSSTEAQAFFDKNYGDKYSMEIISTQDNKGEITINGGELPEVVVTGKAPAKKPEDDNSRPAFHPSERRGVDKWIGANHSSRFNKAYNRMGMNPLNWPKHIPKSYWNSEVHRNVVEGGNIAAGMITAPFALKTMAAAYAVPEIAGAMDLWGAYEGLGRLTSDEGIKKTWNKFSEGDWWGGIKSLGGDALDVAMSLPFLNRVRGITTTTGKGLFNMGMANEFSRLHPTYNFKYNWRTGKFDLTPKPGAAAEATTIAKTDMLPGQVRELPGSPRALGASSNPETYGSMNEVADALEAGEFPTNRQMPTLGSTEPPMMEPLQPATLQNGEVNREYYQQLANLRQQPVRTPDGYDVLPVPSTGNSVTPRPTSVSSFSGAIPPENINRNQFVSFEENPTLFSGNPDFEGLPPAPPELNNAAEAGPVRNAIGEFDWDAYDAANSGTEAASTLPPTVEETFNNLGMSRDPDTGRWSDRWGDNVFNPLEDGSFEFTNSYSPNAQAIVQPDEIEGIINSYRSGTPYLQGTYSTLDDLMVRTGMHIRGRRNMLLGTAGNPAWRLNYDHPSGVSIPINIRDMNGTGRVWTIGQDPIEFPMQGQPIESIYNRVNDYMTGIQGHELTPEQTSLITSRFPVDRGSYRGERVFATSSGVNAPTLHYNPFTSSFNIEGRGFNQFSGPISDLTPEIMAPVRAPEVFTSSSQLPPFSAISRGTDWGQVLGIDPAYSSQIDFGLGRSRPTFQQAREALGISGNRNSINHGDASFYLETVSPQFGTGMPLIEIPHEVPNIHLNMTPWGGELSGEDKRWVATQMANLSRGAKGADIASTSNVNPTLSRFVSDLSAATNLSDLDKYNILMEVINNPGRMFEQVSNFGDYSPFSWSENALKGQNARRFFTEPAINTRVGGLNSYGATLDNSLKQMLNVSPTYSTDPATGVRTLVSPSPSFDLTPDRIKLVNMWLQQNAPNLYGMPYNQSTVPFPVTTIRKKGGKLVKKKFNLNGKKKTCK